MKKLTLFLSLVLAVACLSSCSKQSPADVVKDQLDALMQHNYTKASETLCFGDGEPYTVEDCEMLGKFLKASKRDLTPEQLEASTIKSYEIVSDTIDAEGTNALIVAKVTLGNGNEQLESFALMKDKNGNWRQQGPSREMLKRMSESVTD